jgi:hypothetical protein
MITSECLVESLCRAHGAGISRHGGIMCQVGRALEVHGQSMQLRAFVSQIKISRCSEEPCPHCFRCPAGASGTMVCGSLLLQLSLAPRVLNL